MIDSKLQGVKFIVANTNAQALDISKAPVKLRLGKIVTDIDTDPEIGRKAALESTEAIRNALKDSHMVFIVAGFGGGTGTGAAPVIADICKAIGILTVAVVTKPFSFEGIKRIERAEAGINVLKKSADKVIAIPADRIRSLIPKNAKMIVFIKTLDEIILKSVKHIYLGLLR
jgi:cell division protein FtsZ